MGKKLKSSGKINTGYNLRFNVSEIVERLSQSDKWKSRDVKCSS
jgi:hypothetical protein